MGCDPKLPETNTHRDHFNPRTHVGCDLDILADAQELYRFQSTHPRGVRLKTQFDGRTLEISIHAPTWGATTLQVAFFVHIKFQSTHPRGVRLGIFNGMVTINNFNPRTHVGCDC